MGGITTKMAAPPSKRGRRKMGGGLGPTIQVTYRLPKKLYDKLDKIAESLFQPLPSILRAAAAEYVKNHRPAKWANTGIEFKFPGDQNHPIKQVLDELNRDEEGNEINNTNVAESADTKADTQVSDSNEKTSEENN